MILLKLIQIGVGSWTAQDATHGDNLTLVMESVSKNVMNDKCRRTDRDVSVGEMQFHRGIEGLLTKS